MSIDTAHSKILLLRPRLFTSERTGGGKMGGRRVGLREGGTRRKKEGKHAKVEYSMARVIARGHIRNARCKCDREKEREKRDSRRRMRREDAERKICPKEEQREISKAECTRARCGGRNNGTPVFATPLYLRYSLRVSPLQTILPLTLRFFLGSVYIRGSRVIF